MGRGQDLPCGSAKMLIECRTIGDNLVIDQFVRISLTLHILNLSGRFRYFSITLTCWEQLLYGAWGVGRYSWKQS